MRNRVWKRSREGFAEFRRNESANYLLITALVMPAAVGMVGLGTDYGLWSYTHQTMQSATDSGAVSAATAWASGNRGGINAQAYGVTSSYGFTNGVNGVVVTLNQPPKSGNYTSNGNAIEVIIT